MNATARSVYFVVSCDWSGFSSIVFSPSMSGRSGYLAVGCFGHMSFEYGRPKYSSNPCRVGRNGGGGAGGHLPEKGGADPLPLCILGVGVSRAWVAFPPR